MTDAVWEGGERGPVREHRVVDVRATGVMPGEVAAQVQLELDKASAEGWELQLIQPIIYNSSTTGYLLLIFSRDSVERA
jgi:hypothetical protein